MSFQPPDHPDPMEPGDMVNWQDDRIKELEQEVEHLTGKLRYAYEVVDQRNTMLSDKHKESERLTAELGVLKDAIQKTLNENGHLADGDNCTLIRLKLAITPTEDPPPDDQPSHPGTR